MVIPQGFEPWTLWLRVRCSTSWAKESKLVIGTGFEPVSAAVKGQCVKPLHQPTSQIKTNGARNRTRTCDLPVNSRTLYRLSYSGTCICLIILAQLFFNDKHFFKKRARILPESKSVRLLVLFLLYWWSGYTHCWLPIPYLLNLITLKGPGFL